MSRITPPFQLPSHTSTQHRLAATCSTTLALDALSAGLILPWLALLGYDPHVYFKIPKGSLHTEGPRKNGLATFPRSVFTQFHRISSNLEGEVGVWKLMPHCQYLLGIRLRLRYLVKRTPFTPRLLSYPTSHLISWRSSTRIQIKLNKPFSPIVYIYLSEVTPPKLLINTEKYDVFN